MAERALEVEEVTANVVKQDQTVKERKEESRAWGLTYKDTPFLMWRNIMRRVIDPKLWQKKEGKKCCID